MSSSDLPADSEDLDLSSLLLFLSIDAYPSAVASGGGGKGEFACRFSGLGDPRLIMELLALDDDAKNETNNFIIVVF